MTLAAGTPFDRHVRVVGTRNLRDVGGYPAGPGRRTRWRTLFRADCLDRLAVDAQLQVLDLGVRQVIDLRRADELESRPNVFLESPRVRYLHVPIVDEDPYPLVGSLVATYRVFLDERRDRIVDVFRAVLAPDGLPAVIHCAAGKDRTGVVIALLLAAVGASPDVIAEDYGLSQQCFAMRWEAPGVAEAGSEAMVEDDAPIVDCPPVYMLETLEHLDRVHGGVERYLRDGGLTPDDLARLSALLTEQAGECRAGAG